MIGSIRSRLRLRLRRRMHYWLREGPAYLSASVRAAPDMPHGRRLLHAVRGFDPLEADWYEQAGIARQACVSNHRRETRLHGLNGASAEILDNKLVFAAMLEGAGLPHPEVHAFSHAGRWHFRRKGRSALDPHAPHVVKPVTGKKGRSIRFLAAGEPLPDPGPAPMIACAFARQAAYAARIFPGAVNTLRIVTLNPDGDDPFVLAAVHRFGSAATRGVDNFSAGGIVADVDRSDGVLGRAFRVGAGNRLDWLERHPDTGAAIGGTVLPAFEETMALVRALARTFPFFAYVGWDVAVTDAGPVVIEGNAHPSLRFFQVFSSLLDDPENRRRIEGLENRAYAR